MGEEGQNSCSLCKKELKNYVEINVGQEGESSSNVLKLCPPCFKESLKDEVFEDWRKFKGFVEGFTE